MKTFHNKLLKRKEIVSVVNADSNPGFAKVLADLAKELKVAEELVAIKSIHSNFGRREFQVEAFVYDSVADKTRIEQKPKVVAKKEAQ